MGVCMHKRNKLTKNKKGLTIIEVVVAIAIFGIVMVTIFPAVMILNLANRVSYENTEAAFLAQQSLERVIFESNDATIIELTNILTTDTNLLYTISQNNPQHIILTKTTGRYQTTIDLIEVEDSNLWRIIVVVSSTTTDIAGQRSQLETIVSLGP
jgi:prepilin-type N-terminal cleavage/methylation domain-containing protein